MKYLKKFDKYSQYVAYKGGENFLAPNVSYCVKENEVHYTEFVPHDYSKDYLTTVALDDGSISFVITYGTTVDMLESISYSTNNGLTWATIPNRNDKTSDLQIVIQVNEGDKILWKGTAKQTGYYNPGGFDTQYDGSYFTSTVPFDVEGNLMSLCYGDNFIDINTLTERAQFAQVFTHLGHHVMVGSLVVNARNLILPPTTLGEDCYCGMFWNCTSLTTAPELPATTLAKYCYGDMFNGCTSLTTAPELPATTLTSGCYDRMFKDCTSLNYIKAMFTTTPSTTYTSNWVGGVSANGTFVKNSAAEWDVTGTYAIPSGWTVETATD